MMMMVMVMMMTIVMAVTMTMRCYHQDSKQKRWRSSKLHQNRNAKKVRSKFFFGRRRGRKQEEPFCGWILFESCSSVFVTQLHSSICQTCLVFHHTPRQLVVCEVSPSRSLRSCFMIRSGGGRAHSADGFRVRSMFLELITHGETRELKLARSAHST